MNGKTKPYLSYEDLMQLKPEYQVSEITTRGESVGTYKDENSLFTNSVLYRYNHYHIEITYLNWQTVKDVVPILVLDEYKIMWDRYPDYMERRQQKSK